MAFPNDKKMFSSPSSEVIWTLSNTIINHVLVYCQIPCLLPRGGFGMNYEWRAYSSSIFEKGVRREQNIFASRLPNENNPLSEESLISLLRGLNVEEEITDNRARDFRLSVRTPVHVHPRIARKPIDDDEGGDR